MAGAGMAGAEPSRSGRAAPGRVPPYSTKNTASSATVPTSTVFGAAGFRPPFPPAVADRLLLSALHRSDTIHLWR